MKSQKISTWLLKGILMLSTPLMATTFYVAPDGNDSWSGTLQSINAAQTDGPLATLTGARNAVRRLKQSGPLKSPVTIFIADGSYPISEAFELHPEDSGTPVAPITYRAHGSSPVFLGGIELTDIKVDAQGVWRIPLPQVAAGKWFFEQLFVNQRRATRARTPNQYYSYIQNIREEVIEAGNGRFPKHARQYIDLEPQDVALLKQCPDFREVLLVAFFKWDITRKRILEFDPATNTIMIEGEGLKPWNPIERGTRYFLENLPTALDQPGEWYLDPRGELTYVPLPGETPENTQMVAPKSEKFIVIQGDPTTGAQVEHVSIEGLEFQFANFILPRTGFDALQAAVKIDAAVQIDYARQIQFKNCRFRHVGQYGVWFREACTDCRLEHCLLNDLGAGGVRIGTEKIITEPERQTARILVENNIIQSGSHIFTCAVGVWIGQSGHNQIIRNDIGDFGYTGISVGWTWGYTQSLATHNKIEFNHIHHIGWGILSDMGGVYTLGISEGTTVSNNCIHDIYAHTYGGWGLYPDEGSSQMRLENNLVYQTKTGGFHQHYGEENLIQNNIFAFSHLQQLQCTRVEPHRSFRFLKNIVYWDFGPLLGGPWVQVQMEMDRNCYFQSQKQPFDFAGHTFPEWQAAGRDLNAVIANPEFKNPDQLDFRMQPDAALKSIGFTPFDYTRAGVYGDPEWLAQAQLTPQTRLDFEKVWFCGAISVFLDQPLEHIQAAFEPWLQTPPENFTPRHGWTLTESDGEMLYLQFAAQNFYFVILKSKSVAGSIYLKRLRPDPGSSIHLINRNEAFHWTFDETRGLKIDLSAAQPAENSLVAFRVRGQLTQVTRPPEIQIQGTAPETDVFFAPPKVQLTAPDSPDAIRFTTDGTEPTAQSTQYTRPIEIARPTLLLAAAFKSGKIQSVAARQFIDLADPAKNGVRYEYFEGEFSGRLPYFTQLTPLKTGRANQFRLKNIPSRSINFAVRFLGFLEITRPGEYTFFTESNDGSRLLVNDQWVVENDGEHGATEKSGAYRLEPGRCRIEVTYFQSGGSTALKVSYEGPGIQKQEIPMSLLFWE